MSYTIVWNHNQFSLKKKKMTAHFFLIENEWVYLFKLTIVRKMLVPIAFIYFDYGTHYEEIHVFLWNQIVWYRL